MDKPGPDKVIAVTGATSGIGLAAAKQLARGIVRLLLNPSVRVDAGIYWRHGHPVDPDPAALDGASARRFWEIAEQMCGIPLPASLV